MNDVIALGELLVDFTCAGTSETGMRLFEQNPGGAPANVLTGLSRMGLKTAFIGKVGDDIHGNFLKEVLEKENIGTESLFIDKNYFTTLAFVSIAPNGERSFSFARKPGADTMLTKDEIPENLIRGSKIFHVGSLSLTNEPARSATLYALDIAKDAGCIISYDPNYRAPLWENKQTAINEMRHILKYADVIKLSDEETDLVTPEKDPKKAGEYLINSGIKIVFVTLGKNGAYVFNNEGCVYQPAVPGKVIDTNGAGDSFCSAVLYKICTENKKVKDISLCDLSEFARFGNTAASICVGRRGAIPSMPTLKEVNEKLLSEA